VTRNTEEWAMRYIILYTLVGLGDLCRVIYWDFAINPAPKILFLEPNRNLTFISSVYLKCSKRQSLSIVFMVPIEKIGSVLICKEDMGIIGTTKSIEGGTYIRIIKTDGITKKMVPVSTKKIEEWAINVVYSEDIPTKIIKDYNTLKMISESDNVIYVVSKRMLMKIDIARPDILRELGGRNIAKYKNLVLLKIATNR